MKKILQFILFVLLVTACAKEKSSEILMVKFDTDYIITDLGKLKILIETNLPENTILGVTLKNENIDYIAQDSFEVIGGKAESILSYHNDALVKGEYNLDVIMPIARTQSEKVQKIIGDKGQFLKGENVISTELLGENNNYIKKSMKIEVK